MITNGPVSTTVERGRAYLATQPPSVASELVAALKAGQGVTLDPNGGTVPTAGYVVGVPGLGMVTDGVPSVLDVSQWLRRHDLQGRYVGAWIDGDTGRHYLDVVQILPDLDVALWHARMRGELAVWSLADSREIRTGVELAS